jgi:hypothetical protein
VPAQGHIISSSLSAATPAVRCRQPYRWRRAPADRAIPGALQGEFGFVSSKKLSFLCFQALARTVLAVAGAGWKSWFRGSRPRMTGEGGVGRWRSPLRRSGLARPWAPAFAGATVERASGATVEGASGATLVGAPPANGGGFAGPLKSLKKFGFVSSVFYGRTGFSVGDARRYHGGEGRRRSLTSRSRPHRFAAPGFAGVQLLGNCRS